MIEYSSFEPNEGDIIPQEGFQIPYLSCSADIVIGGGAAGAGKTVAILMDAARHVEVAGYGAIIFRKSYTQIMMQGGLWDESQNLYPYLGGQPSVSRHEWQFEAEEKGKISKIAFRHLSHENELPAYQGAQIPFIGFDELTHFSYKMFMYMLTRNRSTCGVDPVIRATCNPDPDSWLADFLAWWIDEETGYPIPERAGVLRYFLVRGEVLVWGSTKQEVLDQVPDLMEDPLLKGVRPEDLVKSVTFIPGTIQHNQELIRKNPAYLANLMAQSEEDQLRLLKGNWRIRADKLSLCDYMRIQDMFTNVFPDTPRDQFYITCDHARFGRDYCVICTWRDWKVVRMDVLPTSDTNDILRVIKFIRLTYRMIPSSNILVDQDGIGVHDSIQCRVFHGGGAAIKLPRKQIQPEQGVNKELPPDYKNLRTQCYFYLAEEKINKASIYIDLNNVWYHERGKEPRLVEKVKLRGREYTIRQLIRDDLRVVKREDEDSEKKKQMTSKELQKAANGGRSPDFGDTLAMRSYLDFLKQARYLS